MLDAGEPYAPRCHLDGWHPPYAAEPWHGEHEVDGLTHAAGLLAGLALGGMVVGCALGAWLT